MASDTISAIATPAGTGGIGVLRISGPDSAYIAEQLTGQPVPPPRLAALRTFRDATGAPIDRGLLLFFNAPHSYTGEDVLELHAHGGRVLLDLLFDATLACGARAANAGEFTERAFLNGKLDLAQAEAVADLIEAASGAAARSAHRSLQGQFSARIESLSKALIALRAHVEAIIDFPDDEVELLADGAVRARIDEVITELVSVLATAEQGARVRDGLHVVLVGAPNVGKSSLMNALSHTDAALVTPVPGTTRDLIRESFTIDGVAVTLTDTAGLRATDDLVEQLGNERARDALRSADIVLLVTDAELPPPAAELYGALVGNLEFTDDKRLPELIYIQNKIDLFREQPAAAGVAEVQVSALTGEGLATLRECIVKRSGHTGGEPAFSARRRHVQALSDSLAALGRAADLMLPDPPIELISEELRASHEALQSITGRFTTEDLLGQIFASFCIGK
ncbi:MAG: tRNA uridine-5-carboxymethylaminomethyl(34) synthesis GTPase MnmE [Pseudomonadota bacterium]